MGEIFNNVNELVKYKYRFFTTPGHKQGNAYLDFKDVFKYDLTEVDGLDNLHNPSSCIESSLKDLSNFYESKKSYYLVNGSTSGIQIMIFSCLNEGDEILVERGCHKSIINALVLRKVKVNYINREVYNFDLLCPNSSSSICYSSEKSILNDIKNEINKNPKIKCVLLTNPNYYGFYLNQKEIYKYLKSKKVFLIIDSAHGAHIRSFNKDLLCTNKYCDMSVMSAHKTLAVLTQGAYLHVNNLDLIDKSQEYFSIFTTTSPSYLIMISLEKALEECKKYFKNGSNLTEICNDLNKFINLNSSITSINNSWVSLHTKDNFFYDDTRICLKFDFENGNGNELYNYLFSKKIVCEMSFYNGVVLIPTIYNDYEDFKLLKVHLKNFKSERKYSNILKCVYNAYNIKNFKVFEPYEIYTKKCTYVKLKDSVSRISSKDIFLYPPGTPIIMRGEMILKEHVELIDEYRKSSYDVNGLNGDYLSILED